MQLEELRPLNTLLSKIVTSCFQIQPRELAVQAALTAKSHGRAFSSSGKGHGKNLGPRRPSQPHREAPLGLRFFQTYLVPEEKACEVLPTARYYGPPLKTRGLPFRALPDLPTPSHQLPN